MADLAIGISKAAVEALVIKVQSALKEEAEKWLTVQRDLVFITDEFEMMQSFLNSADGERIKNNVVRTWVRQVRNLSYDVEDCIESVLHLDTKKRTWWLQLLPPCAKPKAAARPGLDEAVAEITQLKARVVDVSQRNTRYNLISDSGSKPLALPQETAAASARPFDDILINATKKKSGLSYLARLITRKDTDLQVVSICGTGSDHGKISIIRKVYDDSRIYKDFKCRAWVRLQHPFNPHEFIRSLVAQFYTSTCEAQRGEVVGVHALTMMEGSQGAYLTQEFVEQVNKQRYLVVLEDLSTISQWDAIRTYLPDMKNGSRIVVSTHDLEIASLCPGQPCSVSELRQFSAGHSVCVFFKEGFQYDTVHSFPREEDYHSLCKYGFLGRETEVEELFEEAKKRRLISVWGMPGVGKSVLLRAICNKFDKHTWVNVCHPFNPMDFNQDFLKDLIPNDEDPMEECRDNLQDNKCLVVIDGLHHKDDWDFIKSNLEKYGDHRSCIIIITSDESVAKHCAASSSNDAVYNIKGLQPDAARELFRKVLEDSRSYMVKFMEEDQGEETIAAKEIATAAAQVIALVLAKCGGLPRVIITVARYLATKPRLQQEHFIVGLSQNFVQELSTNPEFESLRGLLEWMHSCLDSCPRHLKKCMLYLSVFPPDTVIRRRRLIRRWIAEGYSKGSDSNSMEKYAEMIFGELVAQSVMQPVPEAGKVIGYRVNGFFREYVISRPAEETVFFPVEVSALGHHTTEGIGQHLAIDTWTSLVLFESLDVSRLRSLTVFKRAWALFILDQMRALRVLDLENAGSVFMDSSTFSFEEIDKLSSRLKFLSLRGQRELDRLPDFMGDPVQLQTLDIRDTSIVSLPPFITKLRKLQHILAGSTIAWAADDTDTIAAAEQQLTPSTSSSRPRTLLASCLPKFRTRAPVASRNGAAGVAVPRGIGRLEALRTLGAVDARTTDAEALQEILDSLHMLKRLQVSGISRKSRCRYLLSNLHELFRLESLSLQFEENNHFVDWDSIRLPECLRSLKMYGHVEQLPVAIKDHGYLVKLTLEMTTLFRTEVIDMLGRLPSLCILRLRVNKDQDGELKFLNNLFRKLQVLEIACKSKLHVRFAKGAMDKLEQLNLHCLQGSVMQVSGLERPVSLEQVWLLRSFDDALKEAVQQQLAKHPKKPAPKLEVQPRSSQASRS